ncbi:periplasmic solute-binding protein [Dissulfurispira thermophila]|uniref:Periplasmic solute-binding protein n=1 Tax=Dissulfurispira thermophila TaxID=2715679 RepID=A0A7G1H1I2_9BACT|nr:metal ABC transporter substrate-binding protein [Dissulfurispira thermophila]BCB95836.1 periplasmic solute-binding protein [Dissulfurispira thermophila]
MKKTFVFLFLLIYLFFARAVLAEPVKVIVSIHPLYDITKQIGKDKVIVKTLLPPAASPHTFEPTPKQMMELYNAKVFIKIGAGLEFWADRVVKAASNKNLMVIDLSNDMPLIYGIHEHEHEHGHGHKGQTADPHFWLDPVLTKKIVDRVANTLIKIDPQNRKLYTDNADSYKKELDRLNEEILQKVKIFKTREYVTFHPAWNYFSKRYGLKVIGVIEEAPGRELAPRDIARIIQGLKKSNARVVFAEPQFNPKIAEAIAKEVNAKVLFLDPIGAANIPDRDTYIKLMRYNLLQMEKAMR